MIVTSIDIGTVNGGFATLDNDKILYADWYQLHPKGRGKGKIKEFEVIDILDKKFFKNKTFFELIKRSDIVLIENQMTRIMLIIQYALGALFHKANIPYKFVRPQDVKRHFNSGTGFHKSNKKTAEEIMEHFYPNYLATVDSNKHDDVSDAILMALYWYQKESGIKPERLPIDIEIKKRRFTNIQKSISKNKKKKNTSHKRRKITKITVSPVLARTLDKLKRK